MKGRKMFNKEHGNLIGTKYANRNFLLNDLTEVNQRYLGGGMSQNYVTTYLFEYLMQERRFEYVCEIGSQKGALSLFWANMAGSTEQFYFDTFEINKNQDWYNRPAEGVGHWFEKLETISPFIKSHEMDIFSDDAKEIIVEKINKYKTLIICDGGNKEAEFASFAPLLKPDDCIAVHDLNVEVFPYQLNLTGFLEDTYHPYFQKNNTLFGIYKKI